MTPPGRCNKCPAKGAAKGKILQNLVKRRFVRGGGGMTPPYNYVYKE